MSESFRQYIGSINSITESNGNDNIFINSRQEIQYRVKSLLLPDDADNDATGYMSSFKDDVVEDNPYDENRIEHFYDQVKHKLFIYTYKIRDDGYRNMRSNDANLVAAPEGFISGIRFFAVPVFTSNSDSDVADWSMRYRWSLYRDYSTREQFIQNILAQKPIGSIYGFDADAFTPSFVIWRENDGSLTAVGSIVSSKTNAMHAVTLESASDRLFSIDLSNYINYCVYDPEHNPCLAFVPEQIYKNIEDEIHKAIMRQKNQYPTRSLENTQNDSQIKKSTGAENEETTVKTDGNIIKIDKPVNEKLIDIDPSNKNDELIITLMEYYSQKDGLFYNRSDFINFHTAVKCSSLVILSGLSGTGKSALVRIYAKALHIVSPDYLVIPVRPSWNDDSDLLGYIDLVHMVYRASDSGFIDLLVRAQENKNKMYLVCFDEMNLARVEHYFSQFLSILEKPANERVLNLYDAQYEGRLYNSKEYPHEIIIGDNIRFIGTVNIDETTYHFSDKVLDRANVIDLNILDYSKDWTATNYASAPQVSWTYDDYAELITTTSTYSAGRIEQLLWEIHTMMQETSDKYGVGPRVVKSIRKYLQNLPKTEYPEFTRRNAVDVQIAQRVLTKVRGPENIIGDILDPNNEKNFIKIFDAYSDLSDFSRSREIVKQKEKEMKSYGYCV